MDTQILKGKQTVSCTLDQYFSVVVTVYKIHPEHDCFVRAWQGDQHNAMSAERSSRTPNGLVNVVVRIQYVAMVEISMRARSTKPTSQKVCKQFETENGGRHDSSVYNWKTILPCLRWHPSFINNTHVLMETPRQAEAQHVTDFGHCDCLVNLYRVSTWIDPMACRTLMPSTFVPVHLSLRTQRKGVGQGRWK